FVCGLFKNPPAFSRGEYQDLSSALDVETEQALWSRIFAARSQEGFSDVAAQDWTPTCLVVSHRPWVLRRADQIIVLNKGRVKAQGKFDDLREIFVEMQPS
ncbi:hypothetical protein NIES2130_36510, partial [Scytonema sp. HK-05]